MVKNKISFLAAAALTLVASGCRSCETIDSSKLDSSEIYQEYSISVAATTTVRAEFRVSGPTGTTVALVAPAKIEHNGKPMAEHLRTVLGGTFYSVETDGFSGKHSFVFTDNAGTQYRNTIAFDPIKIAAERIDINKGVRTVAVPLSRGPADGESLSIQIVSDFEPPNAPANAANSNTNAQGGPDHSTDLTGSFDGEAKTLTVDTEQLRNFAIGPATIRVTVRGSQKPTELGLRGGNISYVIESPTVPAKVF